MSAYKFSLEDLEGIVINPNFKKIEDNRTALRKIAHQNKFFYGLYKEAFDNFSRIKKEDYKEGWQAPALEDYFSDKGFYSYEGLKIGNLIKKLEQDKKKGLIYFG
jgi:hypothetical protein